MILFRDMAGDAATNAAARVKPSHEDLAQLDRPAQDNTWHDTPNINKDAIKGKLQGAYKGNPKEDAKAAAVQTEVVKALGRVGEGAHDGIDGSRLVHVQYISFH